MGYVCLPFLSLFTMASLPDGSFFSEPHVQLLRLCTERLHGSYLHKGSKWYPLELSRMLGLHDSPILASSGVNTSGPGPRGRL